MKKIAILGAGESAIGAALLAQKKGFDIWVSDKNKIASHYKEILIAHKIPFEELSHDKEKILQMDQIIKSPGISPKEPLIKAIREKNIPILSEIAFARNYSQGKIIAITGTNGKTTTASLCYHLLKKSGVDTSLAGNIGESFAKVLSKKDHTYHVLELSSFQLDDTKSLNPHIAILLNISPDHLDCYDYNFQNYIHSKWQISTSLKKDGFFIYNHDDSSIIQALEKWPPLGTPLPFSIKEELPKGAYLKDEVLIFRLPEQKEYSLSIKNFPLKESHNLYNIMASCLASMLIGTPREKLEEYINSFTPIAHRLTKLPSFKGIGFINDSKGTNVHACFYALSSIKGPIIWIAGGIDKGNDYTSLIELVKEKVKFLIALGKDNKTLIDFFDPFVEKIFCFSSMHEAIRKSYELALKGDTILLSPACSSFDLFENYKDRGTQFEKEIKALIKDESTNKTS